MILSNFLFRIRQYAYDNRARLVRITLYVVAFLAATFLVYAAAEQIQKRRYENRIKQLDRDFHAAETRARDAEDRAVKLGYEIDARKAELAELEVKAANADAALKNARGKVVTLKEAYETIRYVPVDLAIPVSVESACRQLAELGYRCE